MSFALHFISFPIEFDFMFSNHFQATVIWCKSVQVFYAYIVFKYRSSVYKISENCKGSFLKRNEDQLLWIAFTWKTLNLEWVKLLCKDRLDQKNDWRKIIFLLNHHFRIHSSKNAYIKFLGKFYVIHLRQ